MCKKFEKSATKIITYIFYRPIYFLIFTGTLKNLARALRVGWAPGVLKVGAIPPLTTPSPLLHDPEHIIIIYWFNWTVCVRVGVLTSISHSQNLHFYRYGYSRWYANNANNKAIKSLSISLSLSLFSYLSSSFSGLESIKIWFGIVYEKYTYVFIIHGIT